MNSNIFQWQNLPARTLAGDPMLEQAWDKLNTHRGGLPILGRSAVALALEHFGSGKERLLVGRQAGKIVAMLILRPQGRLRWITFQPSQMPLGAWVADQSLSPTELARSLCRGPLGFCLSVSFTQIDPVLSLRETDTSDSETSDYIETGWIDIIGGFEDYWAARGKNLRQNMRKQRNKLATEGIETRMRVLCEVYDIAGAIERYGLMESKGWKSDQGTAIHLDNTQGRYYRTLLEDAARRGEAIVCEYLFNDRTVAMNLGLLRDGVLIVLKTTYDETIPSTFSPAFLLRQDELEQIFGEGKIRRVEYYGRLMDWHTKLTDNKRTLFHLTAFRFPLVKRLAHWRRQRIAANASRSHKTDTSPENGLVDQATA